MTVLRSWLAIGAACLFVGACAWLWVYLLDVLAAWRRRRRVIDKLVVVWEQAEREGAVNAALSASDDEVRFYAALNAIQAAAVAQRDAIPLVAGPRRLQ